jgi:hypothetical protein
VGVDEARGDDAAGGVDLFRAAFGDRADGGDLAGRHADIGLVAGLA